MGLPGSPAGEEARLGVLPPAVLALLVGGPRLALIVVVIYLVLNFVVTSLVQPHFIGGAVGLSVTITFLALVFWGWLLGPVGAVLAVPLTLLVKALLVDADPSAGWAHALLGSPAVLRQMTGPGVSQPVEPQPVSQPVEPQPVDPQPVDLQPDARDA